MKVLLHSGKTPSPAIRWPSSLRDEYEIVEKFFILTVIDVSVSVSLIQFFIAHESLLHDSDQPRGLELDSNKRTSLDQGGRLLRDLHAFYNFLIENFYQKHEGVGFHVMWSLPFHDWL